LKQCFVSFLFAQGIAKRHGVYMHHVINYLVYRLDFLCHLQYWMLHNHKTGSRPAPPKQTKPSRSA
jgi:hypothetical protein